MIDPTKLNLKNLGETYRLTPATLAHKISGGKWKPARHLMYMSSLISSEIAKGGARLTVSVPARHGKSEFCSIYTPIWMLENDPTKRVLLASYGADLASKFSRRVRDTFADPSLSDLLRTRLSKDSRQVDFFHTNCDPGGMGSMGMKGGMTGHGADLLLIDDYLKNSAESLSPTVREDVFDTFRSTVFTRLEPGGSIIVVATRWHQDDLIGRIHQEFGHMGWKHIKLPAIAKEGDVLGREPGEPLWPERWSYKALMEIKEVLGSYWWEAEYQQEPMASMRSSELGRLLTRIDAGDVPLSQLKCVRAWDLASTEGGGDWTVGWLMGYHKKQDRWYILDIRRFRKSPLGSEEVMRQTAAEDTNYVPIEVEREPGSSGKSYCEYLAREVFNGYSMKSEHPTGPIEVRASPLIAAIEAGKVFMVRAGWNEALIDELGTFPEGDHDDQVSAGAMAFKHLNKGKYGRVVWGRDAGTGGMRLPNPGHGMKGYRKGVIW